MVILIQSKRVMVCLVLYLSNTMFFIPMIINAYSENVFTNFCLIINGKEGISIYGIFTVIIYQFTPAVVGKSVLCPGNDIPRRYNFMFRHCMLTATLCSTYFFTERKIPLPRSLVDAFLHFFRSRWDPIAPSRSKENLSTIDRPADNLYYRTGSYVEAPL